MKNTLKITKRVVENQKPQNKDILIWDTEIKGFCCKITPKGSRVYMLYYRNKDNRQRKPKIGTHGNITCEQARDIAKEWQSIIAKGGDPSKEKQDGKNAISVKELGDMYFKERLPYLKPRSATELKRLWDKNITPFIGGMKINQVDISDIKKLQTTFSDRPYTANRNLEALNSAFKHAIKHNMLKNSNPCEHVKKFKEKSRERFLSMNELSELSIILKKCEEEKTEFKIVIDLIRLLIFTGCRSSEILTLKWEYVNFENGCLMLPDSKTGAKTVYLAPFALEVLANIEKVKNNPYVIVGKNEGTHLTPPQKAWRRIRKQAGLDDVRIHDLRHSFASIGAASGLSLPIIGALLGHSQPNTTAR